MRSGSVTQAPGLVRLTEVVCILLEPPKPPCPVPGRSPSAFGDPCSGPPKTWVLPAKREVHKATMSEYLTLRRIYNF